MLAMLQRFLPRSCSLIYKNKLNISFLFRDVFCSENLLNCDEKVDWKACKLNKEEEVALVENFRKKFSKYDFTS